VHGILFQLVEHRKLPWVLVFSALTALALPAQLLGVLRARRAQSARSPAPR